MPYLLETAVQTLTIQGVLANRKSQNTSKGKPKDKAEHPPPPPIFANLTRVLAPSDLVRPLVQKIRPDSNDALFVLPDLPQRPASTRPPPGTLHLSATLGARLGSGRTGLVFALENVAVDDPSVDDPALVVKVARLNKLPSLSREAWFYDELEPLQGVAVPRCYGWFECEIDEPDAPGWANLHGRHRDYAVWLETRRGALHPLLQKQRGRRNVFSVLVLERLGERLPVRTPVSKEDRKDIVSLYRAIGRCGVLIPQCDIRWQNVLRTPSPPHPGLPPLPSPRSGRTHSFRLVDFDIARKTNFSRSGRKQAYLPAAASLFMDVEYMRVPDDTVSTASESAECWEAELKDDD